MSAENPLRSTVTEHGSNGIVNNVGPETTYNGSRTTNTDIKHPHWKKLKRLCKQSSNAFHTGAEHAGWYAASIGSGTVFLQLAEKTQVITYTNTPIVSGVAYAAMLGLLGLVGEGTIRQQFANGRSGSAYTHAGATIGLKRVERNLRKGKKGEEKVSPEEAKEIITDIKKTLQERVGRNKKTDTHMPPSSDIPEQTKKRMDTVLNWTKRTYVAGQVAEELPVLGAALLANVTSVRELAVFLGGTAVPTLAIRGVQYWKNRKYEGDEPIFFRRTRKRLKQAGEVFKRPSSSL